MNDDVSMTATRPRRHLFIGVLLGSSLILNLTALCLPFTMIDAATSLAYIYGLFGSVGMLMDSDMVALAILVVVFSIIFPFAKLSALMWLWWYGVSTPRRMRWLDWTEKLGKWSFFDVYLVAIMVAITNDQWLISTASLPGLTCFMIALTLGMLAGEWLSATTPKAQPVSESVPSHSPILLLLLLLAIGGLFAAAVFVPFIQIDDWRLSDRAYSLAELVPALQENDSPALALAVGLFLIIMPALGWWNAAIMMLGWWGRRPPATLLSIQQLIGRWSMLPVFALSLAVFFAEGHHFLGTETRAGVWILVGGLTLTVIGQFLVARLWRHT
jgi:uncharacterized paraquat-inducible protein A